MKRKLKFLKCSFCQEVSGAVHIFYGQYTTLWLNDDKFVPVLN